MKLNKPLMHVRLYQLQFFYWDPRIDPREPEYDPCYDPSLQGSFFMFANVNTIQYQQIQKRYNSDTKKIM